MDPFLYQYAVGGTVFGVGMIYAYRQGYVGLSGKALQRAILMLGGLAFFAILQGYLQYAPMTELPAIPYTGEPLTKGMIGQPIDYAVMVGYFVAILVIGTFFGQGQKDTKDFFFGGQRFSWWLIAFSLVASVIGSYSFVKYSQVAFNHGLASSQTYLNDWFWLPLLLFGWLPILYFSRLTSVPEYFEHRFSRATRNVVTGLLLLYLVGYVGINLFTMGRALETLLGVDVFVAACVVAAISAVYVTMGGQTSVIMTDLFQGVMLMATGLVILVLGVDHLGGWDIFWQHLPRGHRQAFPDFNSDPTYNAVGIFWQDAMAGSAMYYFLNQGILMRFMAARSVEEGRKAAMAVLAILMPLAAIVVASGGWVGRALAHAGVMPSDMPPRDVFFLTAEFLAVPGVFGLVLAALTAALMSTVDTLITAVAAVVVNDIIRPLRPKSTETELLKAARITSMAVAIIGVALVPVFQQFDSIYAAHGAFTAAITPPMVVALLLGVFWRRFTTSAALATLIGGTFMVFLSVLEPSIIAPFAHGTPAGEAGEGFLGGAKQYAFMRAFFGLVVCSVIAVTVTLFTTARPLAEVRGYVWGTVETAVGRYTGREGAESYSAWVNASVTRLDDDGRHGPGQLPAARIGAELAKELDATVGSLIYVADTRVWLGGLRSSHAMVVGIDEDGGHSLALAPDAWDAAVGEARADKSVVVQRLYA